MSRPTNETFCYFVPDATVPVVVCSDRRMEDVELEEFLATARFFPIFLVAALELTDHEDALQALRGKARANGLAGPLPPGELERTYEFRFATLRPESPLTMTQLAEAILDTRLLHRQLLTIGDAIRHVIFGEPDELDQMKLLTVSTSRMASIVRTVQS